MAIVKILARHSASYTSLVKYVLRYIGDEDKAEKIRFYAYNLRSNNIGGFVNEFVANESFRQNHRIDAVMLTHEIVSFSARENKNEITGEMIDDLAREYMRLRGDKAVMLGAAHHDKEHFHLHFCVSALEYRTGKSFGLNKQQLKELKLSFQQYHNIRYPELKQSFPEHGKAERYLSHSRWRIQRREQIEKRVKECLVGATTQNQFLARLRDDQLHHYERDGVPAGIEADDMRFRFSRLLGNAFETLPVERSEEEKALAEIRNIRVRRLERDARSPDFEQRQR